MKKSQAIRIGVVIVVSMLLVGAYVVYSLSGRGSDEGGLLSRSAAASKRQIEDLVGSQLKSIVNARLNPQLDFRSIEYEAPLTVCIHHITLTSDSPDPVTGQPVAMLFAESATLTLGEIPNRGKPIVIERLQLVRPQLQLIAFPDEPTRFIGFDQFVKTSSSSASPVTAESVGAPTISDVLKLRKIAISDGQVIFDARLPDATAMMLDGIHADLDVTPDADGRFKLATRIGRDRVFELDVAATLDLDRAQLLDANLKLSADLCEEDRSYIPPQLQAMLAQYNVIGNLNVTAIGWIPLSDPLGAELNLDVALDGGSITLGDYQVGVRLANVTALLADRAVVVEKGDIFAIGGFVSVVGRIDLMPPYPATVTGSARHLDLSRLMSAKAASEPTSLAGQLDATLQLNRVPVAGLLDRYRAAVASNALAMPSPDPGGDVDPELLKQTVAQGQMISMPDDWGSMNLSLRDARLVRIPVMSSMRDAVIRTLRLATFNFDQAPPANEKATIAARFTGERVVFDQIDYSSSLIAARGSGNIGLNQTLDLRFNAGPLEKLQNNLGMVGEWLGKVTDALAGYRVSGTFSQPRVQVEIGGRAVN
jgi:hypothetical protein